MKDQIKRAWYICRKDLRAYYLKPPLISWGLMFPAAIALAFYLRNPGDIGEVIPGLVGITLLFGATSMEAVVIAFEKRVGALERLAMAPVSPAAILLGKASSGAILALGLGIVVTAAALPFARADAVSFTDLCCTLVTLLLGAAVSSLLGAFVSVAVREVFDAMTLANYFRFPMIFLCGVFAPLTNMPQLLQWVAYCLPLTYVVDALRQPLQGAQGMAFSVALDWGLTALFSLVLYLVAWRLLVRKLEEPL